MCIVKLFPVPFVDQIRRALFALREDASEILADDAEREELHPAEEEQHLSLGIIGEYLGRVFTESKQRPTYLIDERDGEKFDYSVLRKEMK